MRKRQVIFFIIVFICFGLIDCRADVICNRGLHLLPNKDGCTSCVIANGNYCPDGKNYYCCPPGTEVSRNHATSIDDCVPCKEGYSNPDSCGVCQKDPIKYCFKKESVDGNEYQISENQPDSEWIKIGEEKEVICSEDDKCYVDINDNYIWGKYDNRSGYTLQLEIIEKENCKKVIEEK